MSLSKTGVLFNPAVLLLGILLISRATLAGESNDRRVQGEEDIEWSSIVENNLKPLVVVTNRPSAGFLLKDRMKHYGVPGVGVAVIKDGKLAFSAGYGVADMETGRAVDIKTLFRACSIGKPVTALAALRLVDRGMLQLDGSVNQQLTSWQIPSYEPADHRLVSLRHLLCHSGGLSDDPKLSYEIGQEIPTLVQVLNGEAPAKSSPVQVDTAPGEVYRYSNQGYCILQLLMTDVTGKPFDELMDELVLKPMGMNHSTFNQYLGPELLARSTTGYMSNGEEIPGKRMITPAKAAAGLWTTPVDLAKLALSVMHSYDGDKEALLSKRLTEEMLTAQIGDRGLGFTVSNETEDFSFSHGGASEGYRCFMVVYPERREGVVMMTNSDAGMGLYYEILRGIASELGWPGNQPIQKSIVDLPTQSMAAFEGTYLMRESLELRISVEGDHLVMKAPRSSYSLYPENNTKFFDLDLGFTLDFVSDELGIVKEVIMDRGGLFTTLVRVQ